MGLMDSLIGVGGSLLTGALNNDAAQSRQDSANQFSAQQYATRYQTTVKDMEAAGLNPMLAYQGISGSAPTGGIASSSGTPDIGAQYNQGRINSAQVANIEADTANKDAEAKLLEARAAAEWASADQSKANVSQISANVDKIREEIKNIPFEGVRLRQVAQMLSQQSTLMAQQGVSEQERQKVLSATASKLHAEGLIATADYDAIVKTHGVGRLAREVKPISDIGSDWLNPGKWFTNKSSSTSTSTSSSTVRHLGD